VQRKNLSGTYTKRLSVEQVIDDVSKEIQNSTGDYPQNQSVTTRPPSAGGRSEIPLTLSQEHLQFVDGIDEVPAWLQEQAWALVTRMNQLTYIDGDFDFERMMCGVRSQLRPLVWKRKLTTLDMQSIEYFVGVQLRKSKGGRERDKIAPGFQTIVHQEMGGVGGIIDQNSGGGNAAMGSMNRINPRGRSNR
jgi:hypothetical protein